MRPCAFCRKTLVTSTKGSFHKAKISNSFKTQQGSRTIQTFSFLNYQDHGILKIMNSAYLCAIKKNLNQLNSSQLTPTQLKQILEICQHIARAKNNSDSFISQLFGPRHFRKVNSACRSNSTQPNLPQLKDFKLFQNIASVSTKSDMHILQKQLGPLHF